MPDGFNKQDHFQGEFSVLCFVDIAVTHTVFMYLTTVEKKS